MHRLRAPLLQRLLNKRQIQQQRFVWHAGYEDSKAADVLLAEIRDLQTTERRLAAELKLCTFPDNPLYAAEQARVAAALKALKLKYEKFTGEPAADENNP